MAKRRSSGSSEENDDATPAAIERLTDELRVLRETLDEIRQDMDYVIRNGKLGCSYLPPGFRLTSCAADPTAEDFAEQLNALTPSDLPPGKRPPSAATVTEVFDDGSSIEVSTNPPPPLSTRQFHHGETAPAIPFCCAQPELEWIGDHENPEIICARCGEIVAVPADASRPRRELVYDDVSPTPISDAEPATDEADFYCCAAPLLEWYGSPDAPSIGCSHCGYVVVENGCVLERSAGDEEQMEQPTQQQGFLFAEDGD